MGNAKVQVDEHLVVSQGNKPSCETVHQKTSCTPEVAAVLNELASHGITATLVEQVLGCTYNAAADRRANFQTAMTAYTELKRWVQLHNGSKEGGCLPIVPVQRLSSLMNWPSVQPVCGSALPWLGATGFVGPVVQRVPHPGFVPAYFAAINTIYRQQQLAPEAAAAEVKAAAAHCAAAGASVQDIMQAAAAHVEVTGTEQGALQLETYNQCLQGRLDLAWDKQLKAMTPHQQQHVKLVKFDLDQVAVAGAAADQA